MIAEYRGEFICDLAEVYHIYDYHSIPVETLGMLCSGLGPDSRIGMKQAKRYASRDTILLAMICDELNDIRWGLLSDENEKPEHITLSLYEPEKEESNVITYDSGADFEGARAEILEEMK